MKIVYRVSEYAPVKSTGLKDRYLEYSKAQIQQVCFNSLPEKCDITYVADGVSDNLMESMQASRPGNVVHEKKNSRVFRTASSISQFLHNLCRRDHEACRGRPRRVNLCL